MAKQIVERMLSLFMIWIGEKSAFWIWYDEQKWKA